ncbi:MAG TPA: DUF4231 domain-containing protein [Candidatus Angelobacter sp.]|nr:DUF4231 domain-containing protein [Candidatus Angelobacter sp.]
MSATATNLARVPTPETRWDPTKIVASIDIIRTNAEAFANDAIAWYFHKKTAKARMSRICRAASIAFISTGGIIPLLSSVSFINQKVVNLSAWGYVLLGVGASFIALDKFFGFSSGWTRYILAAQAIQKTTYSFEIDWTRLRARVGTREPVQTEVEEFLQIAKTLYEAVSSCIAQETQQWATEFQQSLADLELATQAKIRVNEPGALSVSLTNAGTMDSKPEVFIDDLSFGVTDGKSWAIARLAPGQHVVRVVSSIGGKRVEASEIATVPPGGKTQVSLSLI